MDGGYPHDLPHPRAPRRCRPQTLPLRCSVCRNTARTIASAVASSVPWQRRSLAWRVALATARGDLETVWLVRSGSGFTEARFCTRCAPAGDLWAPECRVCGDGPIVVLAPTRMLPGMPQLPTAPGLALRALQRRGWGIGGELMCGPCRRGKGQLEVAAASVSTTMTNI